MKKHRSNSCIFENDFKSRTTVTSPSLITAIYNKAENQEVIYPISKNRKSESKKGPLKYFKKSPDYIADRIKVDEFLKMKKANTKVQFLTINRDISHLKDKNQTSHASIKLKRENGFVLPQEVSMFPSERHEICQNGDEFSNLFPYVLQKYGMNNGANYGSPPTVRKSKSPKKNPVPGRQDVSNLLVWYKIMKNKYFDNEIKESMFAECKGVIAITLKEIMNQISFSCHERGELILDLFRTYSKLINKSIEVLNKKYENEIKLLNLNYKETKSKLKEKIKILTNKIHFFESQNISLQQSEDDLKKKLFDLEQVIENYKKSENSLRRRTSMSIKKESDIYNYEKFLTSNLGNSLSNMQSLDSSPELKTSGLINARIIRYGTIQSHMDEYDQNLIDTEVIS
ncbi:hypothetical protein SteCoe_18975 [Stentor coeruleus]|uniref:Uncharacterized protein n=1 Tax=Stentor coeruleus TaxID=5963 RepID=A0A1R2BV88_9CILI|nr:hypothetical protein SteCoe_18975 [Stentor coeruleus]